MVKFKELREDRDFLQKDIAKVLCVTQQQYSRIEKLENELSYDGLVKLSEFYNVSVDYLLGLTDVMKPYPRSFKHKSTKS